MAGLAGLFGKDSAAYQLFVWQVMGQLVSTVLGPAFTAMAQQVNAAHPLADMDPASAAAAVVREYLASAEGKAIAARAGLRGDEYAALVEIARGHIPPATAAAAEARGYTDAAGVAEAGKHAGMPAAEVDVLRKMSKVYLPPAAAAEAANRHYISTAAAHEAGKHAGMAPADVDTLIHIAGTAPAPQELAVALRRGLIPAGGTGAGATSFEQGISEGNLGNKWADVIRELAVAQPTPEAMLNAYLEGQIGEAEARREYAKLGGDPAYFDVLYNTQGSAPTPLEAADMANRGIIPWDGVGPDVVSYQQSFLEGPWRNKWSQPYREAARYIPPPRTTTAMLRNGSIDKATATAWFKATGMDDATAAAMIADAQHDASAGDRDLTVAQVVGMYEAQLIAGDDATNLLTAVGYSADNAARILAYADLRRSITAVNYAVNRLQSLFVAHKIDEQVVRNGMATLGVPADQVDSIVAVWTLTRAANIKPLSQAQIAQAWQYQIIDQGEALTELQHLGMTARDAWVYLSIHNKAPLPGAPTPTSL